MLCSGLDGCKSILSEPKRGQILPAALLVSLPGSGRWPTTASGRLLLFKTCSAVIAREGSTLPGAAGRLPQIHAEKRPLHVDVHKDTLEKQAPALLAPILINRCQDVGGRNEAGFGTDDAARCTLRDDYIIPPKEMLHVKVFFVPTLQCHDDIESRKAA